MHSFLRVLVVLCAAVSCALFAPDADARSAGVASTLFLGRNPPSCNSCHGGGTAPTVNLSASAATIQPGTQITLTFTVATVNGNPGAAGFNLRSSQQGTFAVGGPSSANTRILAGTNGWSEATHTARKAGEPATFTVLWTPTATTSGMVTFTAWGNAVNANGTNQGDQAASDTTTVTIESTICTTTFYRDLDGDGYGATLSGTQMGCTAPSGYVENNTDCNDGNGAIHPGAAEVCNGIDDNCAGGIDNGLPTSTFYRDADADTYGNPSVTKAACNLAQAGAGYVTNNTDCNDANGAIHPGAAEVCNGVDDDCAGGIDNGLPTSTFHRDADSDTYGNPSVSKSACNLAQAGAGYVANNTDCNDSSGAIHPGATEVCNGVDENCAGGADDGLATTTFFRDADGDTYGNAAVTKAACSLAVAGDGYVSNGTDCNDADRNIYPGAPEICSNQKDDNCNNIVDTDATANSTFYRDADGDGYGAAASGTAQACAPPSGYVSRNDDCNDGDAAIHPSASEACDGKDNDCDTNNDEGFGTQSCGVGECARTVNLCDHGTPKTCMAGSPVPEVCGNGKDDNCNNDIDERCGSGDGGNPDSAVPDAGDAGTDDAADAGSDAAEPPDGGNTGGNSGSGSGGDGGTSGGAGGGSGGSAGAGARPGGGAGGAPGGSPPGDEDEGCSCRTVGAPFPGSLSLFVIAGALGFAFWRRATRRRASAPPNG